MTEGQLVALALCSWRFRSRLQRGVTDEVIEYDASIPGYKGRRVVQFRRVDTRSDALRELLAPGFAAPEKAAA